MTFTLTGIFIILVFWRPQEWLLPWMYGWPLLDGIVYASLLGLLLEINQRKMQFTRSPAIYLLAGLWLSTLLSHVVHTYFAGLMGTIPETGKICFFSLLLLCVIDRPERARRLAVLFVIGACIMAANSLMQEYTGLGFAGQEPIYTVNPKTDEPIVRTLFFGIFSDPNDTAQFLVTCMPFVFALPRRLNLMTTIGCCAVCVFLLEAFLTTHSRGGQVGLVTLVTMVLVLRLPARWTPRAILVMLVGGLVFCLVKGGALLDASSQDRVVFWGLANQYFKHEPIFGIGYGMFWEVAGDRAAHNAFVSTYTEIGIVGYWFWFGLLVLGILGCWRVRMLLSDARTDTERYVRRFAGLTILALCAFCASAYFLSRAWVYPMFFLLSVANAVPSIAEDLRPDAPPLLNARKDLLVTNTLGTIGSIAYIYFSIVILNRAFYG